MNQLWRLAFVVVVFCVSLSVWATGNGDGTSELTIKGRAYTVSCMYYSNITSDLDVNYHNELLPWGSRVFLHAGWGGKRWVSQPTIHEAPFVWEEITDIEMKSVSPYTWNAAFSKGLHDRSEGAIRTEMDFVIRVQLPSGQSYWDKPARGDTSYYVAALPAGQTCISGASDLPAMLDLMVKAGH